MSKERNVSRTYSLPSSLVDQIQSYGKETERNESQVIRFIVKKFFKETMEGQN